MSESRTTLSFVGVAAALVALAWAATPSRLAPEALADRGQAFFPAFTDPNAAASLEVVEFDEATSAARPFKVLNRDGRWTIPSHDDYPADARNRLSSIAAAVVALRKDDVASDSASDHARCGVLDPLEPLPSAKGRGVRITIRGVNDVLLADIIAGAPLDGRPQFRYVRLPGQKRTYVARVDALNISTRFEDWIERNLLQVERDDIDQIVIRNYTVDAKSGAVAEREQLSLRKTGKDVWSLDGTPGHTLNSFTTNLLVTKLVDLTIEDVRPKPATVAASLAGAPGAKLSPPDVAELASRGFYFTQDGRLLANQGEVLVHTSSGVFYALRFGEVAGDDRRYVFISAGFDPTVAQGDAAQSARARLDILRARFAPWYYVVSDDSFTKIRVSRASLLKR